MLIDFVNQALPMARSEVALAPKGVTETVTVEARTVHLFQKKIKDLYIVVASVRIMVAALVLIAVAVVVP